MNTKNVSVLWDDIAISFMHLPENVSHLVLFYVTYSTTVLY